ncbi:MAG: aspartate aminotransferase family protein [Desulfobacteraceae bacterium]|jgi:acetylornithine aminotransferase|nr:aspartate aminotransferase family protein [Desulfobacteraceae bacterium]
MDHVLWCNRHPLVLPDIVKGEGCYLYDLQGQKYLDLESGIWCLPLGHCHPQINAAIRAQADILAHSGYIYANPVMEKAASAVLDLLNLPEGKCVFLSSGSEAVEFGVQALRKITARPLILTLSDSFLGSYGSVGSKRKDEWYLFDWQECHNCNTADACNPECRYFSKIPFDRIGGFVFEPGSSSGLVRFPPKSFIQNLVKFIRDHDGFIQINEITTGFGRTGKWFGFEHYGIEPDIVSMGKGLGNGYPVSAIAMTPEIIEHLSKISFYYYQSHQNDPLGCAVARAVVKILQEEKIIEKSKAIADYFLSELQQLKQKYSMIQEIRGRGLMFAIEFKDTLADDRLSDLYVKCIQRGFILAKRPGLNVFRIDPPLIIQKKDIDNFLETLDQLLADIG